MNWLKHKVTRLQLWNICYFSIYSVKFGLTVKLLTVWIKFVSALVKLVESCGVGLFFLWALAFQFLCRDQTLNNGRESYNRVQLVQHRNHFEILWCNCVSLHENSGVCSSDDQNRIRICIWNNFSLWLCCHSLLSPAVSLSSSLSLCSTHCSYGDTAITNRMNMVNIRYS